MFERFQSIIVLWLSLEQRQCITPPSILTLCSFASLFRLLRRSILTAVMLDLRFSHFYLGALLSLPYIVCLFYRWREFGDITIIGSYYGVPIIQRLVHPRSGCLYHPPSILIALSLRSFACFACLFLRRPHQPFIILSISYVREISLSVLWYYLYYGLVFEYINLSDIDRQSERSKRL